MLNHLKEKKEVGFFTSIAGLMNSCSVLDLDAFERNTKAEGLGVGSEGAAGINSKFIPEKMQKFVKISKFQGRRTCMTPNSPVPYSALSN